MRSSGRHKIPADAVDVRVVKCWYQAGAQVWETNKRLLTPELLLKDDNLVKRELFEGFNSSWRREICEHQR